MRQPRFESVQVLRIGPHWIHFYSQHEDLLYILTTASSTCLSTTGSHLSYFYYLRAAAAGPTSVIEMTVPRMKPHLDTGCT